VTFRDVTVRWSAGSVTANGAYGLYPVSSSDVLIEDCDVSGASDAGIYVGQSTDVIVRNNRAHGNVAGIEIENTTNAEVYGNHAYDNAGGILVFNLPVLPVKGQRALVHDNDIDANNHPNFAEAGTVVADVPPGTGLMIMSKDVVEARNNDIHDNVSTGVLIISYLAVNSTFEDPEYDAYPETIYLHDNTFTNNGADPQGLLDQVAAIAGVTALEQILWDGFYDVAKVNTDGSLSICLENNGGASFRNLVLPSNMVGTNTDPSPHACAQPLLPAVTF
jgi:parallel beta-helix repeat protein